MLLGLSSQDQPVIVAYHSHPALQGSRALHRVASNSGQDLGNGSVADQLGRRLSQRHRRPARGPGIADVPEDDHAMRAAIYVNREGGTDDLTLDPVRTGQDTVNRSDESPSGPRRRSEKQASTNARSRVGMMSRKSRPRNSSNGKPSI